MIYSIDTSALLDGWIRYYPPDIFPGLWRRIEDLIGQGALRATEEVLEELKRKDDDVFKWAKLHMEMFVPIDESTQEIVTTILKDFEKLVDTRKNRSFADPFVIALAHLNKCTIVSGEKGTGNPDRPKIPDVCRALGIRCISLLELIRREGWSFHSQ